MHSQSQTNGDKSILLFQAVTARNTVTVRHLISKGASPEKTLHELVLANDKKGMELLLRHNIPLNGLYNRRSALYLATELGRHGMIELLIKHGASVGKTLLDLVATYDQDSIQLLLKNGVNIDELYDGKSALYHAFELRNETIVKMLIQNGASIRIMLDCAVKQDWFSHTIDYLLTMFDNIDQPVDQDQTTLIAYVAEQRPRRERNEILMYLMDHGATIEGVRVDGKPLLYHLIHAYTNTPEYFAALAFDERANIKVRIATILQKDTDVIAESLWLLAKDNNFEAVTLLLDNGVPPNIRYSSTQKTVTALDAAIETGSEDMINLLVGRGADCHQMRDGRKLVDVAQESVTLKKAEECVYTEKQTSTFFQQQQK